MTEESHGKEWPAGGSGSVIQSVSNKPTLDLYIGHYVSAIMTDIGPEAWQWGIRLDNGVIIYNKDRREFVQPQDIVGAKLKTIAYSEADTTIHFSNGFKWSLTPTQYAIADPAHGGEVYPQWPEELEHAGIPSHPKEAVSDPPQEGWNKHREGLLHQADARHQCEAQEIVDALKAEDEEAMQRLEAELEAEEEKDGS